MDDETTIEERTDDNASASVTEHEPSSKSDSRLKRLIKRFGVAGFLFFLIKGVVLYILIPLGLFKWLGGC